MVWMNVAVVGFGGAGQEIAKILADRSDADVYVISDIRKYELPFFDFSEFEEIISAVFPYDFVVLVAGLGGRGGKYLVETARLMRDVATVFVVWPLHIEKMRIAEAEKQISRLRGTVFIRRLDDCFRKVSKDRSLADVLKAFDEEIAREIAVILRELRQ